jgi:hypothetical protein
MTARPPFAPRAPWDSVKTSGELRVLETEVAQLREALRHPPPREEGDDALNERRALVVRVGTLEDERVTLATRRDVLRREFDAEVRAARRRDGRLRALGQLLGLVMSVGLALLAAPLLLDAPPESSAAGFPGLALVALATLGLGVRARRR